MWISKSEKERLETELRNVTHDRNMWKAKYEALTQDKVSYLGTEAVVMSVKMMNDILDPIRERDLTIDVLRHELESYKQKFADEVQKRLALISQMGE